jgi:hypothetical protein
MTLDKIQKILEPEILDEMNSLTPEQLEAKLVTSEKAIKEAKEQLEANPNFQELKENLKALRSGFTEVKKRQNSIIQYCLIRLEELGK